MNVFEIISTYHEGLWQGLLVTLRLCLIIWSSGIIIGSLLGVAAAKWRESAGYFVTSTAFLLSSMPVLVLLFWLHYPAQTALDIVVDPFYTAALAISVINVFAVARLIQGALLDFPKEYLLAARVSGLTEWQSIRFVQFPLIFRQTIPALLNLQVTMLQATLFASLISVNELFRVAEHINSEIYRPVQIYTALGLFYLMVCLPMNGLASWLRYSFTRNLSAAE